MSRIASDILSFENQIQQLFHKQRIGNLHNKRCNEWQTEGKGNSPLGFV